MAIMVNLDVMMAKRKMSLNELAQRVDLTLANLSILKNNHAKAVRFTTLEAICKALDCQPGDILEYVPDDAGNALRKGEIRHGLCLAQSGRSGVGRDRLGSAGRRPGPEG